MGSEKKSRGLRLILRLIGIASAIILLSGTVMGFMLWQRILKPNVTTGEEMSADFYIPTGSRFEDVLNMLDEQGFLDDRSSLEWLAVRKNYPNNVRPGRYRLTGGMNNNELVNMLRSGSQLPVNLVFISQRTVDDLASVVSRQIEADSVSISELARDREFLGTLGYTPETLPALFIPNTYEFFWNTSAEQFFARMKAENERFWNGHRDNRLTAVGLNRVQASTLASIVSEETVKEEEMPVIAGVYLNRLKRGMRLQADPTVKFAIGDFTVNRILRVHLEVDSPYNTYRYGGIPPGPINIPPTQAIEAVLNAGEHDYLYFCAREDFSGYHRFARTLTEHNRNARLYQEALNRRRVFR